MIPVPLRQRTKKSLLHLLQVVYFSLQPMDFEQMDFRILTSEGLRASRLRSAKGFALPQD
jgi:hypothetical protein